MINSNPFKWDITNYSKNGLNYLKIGACSPKSGIL
jgi:hypothetical protein